MMKICREAMLTIAIGVLCISAAGCDDDPQRISLREDDPRRTLLCEADHQSILQVSRKFLGRVSKGEVEPGRYDFGRNPSSGAVSELHEAISSLSPTRVIIQEEGFLIIELMGGFDHVGVKAYPVDFKEPYPDFRYGNRKLVDGLWYYDDGYVNDPTYDEKIDSIIEEGRKTD